MMYDVWMNREKGWRGARVQGREGRGSGGVSHGDWHAATCGLGALGCAPRVREPCFM
jgi:hypothetical protein